MSAIPKRPEDFDVGGGDIPSSETEEEALQSQAMTLFDADGIYLSGPIRCVDDNGKGWREELIEDYGDEFVFNNPIDNYDPDAVDILNDPIHYDPDAEREQIVPSEYVMEDKLQINRSEYVFLGLPENIARGSCMEVMYAYMTDTPFFVWTMDGQSESGWLYHHSAFMSDDRDEIMEEIRRWK